LVRAALNVTRDAVGVKTFPISKPVFRVLL